MKKIISLTLAIIIALTPCAFAKNTDKNPSGEYFDLVKDFIMENYKFEISETDLYKNALDEILKNNPELLETALKGSTNSLDKYSKYLTKEEFDSWLTSVEGQFVGIGVIIEEKNGYITVIDSIDNSPAKSAGLLPGDKFLTVSGTDVAGKSLEYVKSLVIGKVDTEVEIEILRDNQTLSFKLKRAHVEQTTISSAVLKDENIGYIQISQFATTTAADLKKALAEFDEKKINKIILDLRDNPGGEKQAVVDCLSMFVPKGPVMHIEYADSTMNEVFYSTNKNPGKYKLAVLVNENSASGAEAFSGTIKDTKSGVLIGETTYGKGTVQTLMPLSIGGGLKLTIGTYTTANKNEVNQIGVTPDYELRNITMTLEENEEFPKIEFAAIIDANSSKETIETIEQRLAILKISPGEVDGVFDDSTVSAIKMFQEKFGMEITGDMDIMTQVELNNATREIKTMQDRQLDKAIELLK